jgi:hypothetical protein
MHRYLRLQTVLLSLAVFLFSLDAIGAGVDARLDRAKVAEGETVLLTLSTAGEGTGSPDLSPLAEDFDVLNQGQSTRLQIVNGRTSSSREWQIVLAPKRVGQLRVPALDLGGALSEPLTLEVLPAAQAAKTGSPRPVLLEVEVSPDKPYVQGKVIYTVRLLSRLPLRQATLTDPSAGNAIIERLGEDKHYDTDRDGKIYQVIERRYAMFPQHSGELQIDPPLLSAKIPERGQEGPSLRERFFGGRDLFPNFDRIFGSDPFAEMGDIFEQTRPMQLRGRDVTLDVQPQPAGTPTPWLPAESLTLSEVWSPNPPEFRVGEPVTRTITITARGVTAAQLPDLTQHTVPEINVYPDKMQVETRADGDTLVAHKVLKAALVPSTPGRFTLPEIKLNWWDTESDKLQVARLPAREIQVLPGAAGAAAAMSAPKQATTPSTTALESASAPARIETAKATGSTGAWASTIQAIRATPCWSWLTSAFALAWLISTGLWWRARSTRPAVTVTAGETRTAAQPDAGEALHQFELACRNDDAKSARQALLDWAAARWPDRRLRRLEDLAQRLPPEAARPLSELDRYLYAGSAQSGNGTNAWRQLAPLLRKVAKSADRKAPDTPLPPLYPQGA